MPASGPFSSTSFTAYSAQSSSVYVLPYSGPKMALMDEVMTMRLRASLRAISKREQSCAARNQRLVLPMGDGTLHQSYRTIDSRTDDHLRVGDTLAARRRDVDDTGDPSHRVVVRVLLSEADSQRGIRFFCKNDGPQ